MQFTFETVYDQKALTAMAKVLRKTVRRKRSRRAHIFGWIVMAFALLLSFLPGEEGFTIEARNVFTWIITAVLLGTLLFEDRLNGAIAKKRLPPGTGMSKVTFTEEAYASTTELGDSQWHYEKVGALAQTKDYFVFLFSQSHAQVFSKASITGGTCEEFVRFIEEKTNKTMITVK